MRAAIPESFSLCHTGGMSLLRTIRLATPLGVAAALFSAPQGGAQVVAPVVQPLPAGQELDFSGYLQLVAATARAQGVSQPVIARMTAGLT